jgi:hypothetical protein
LSFEERAGSGDLVDCTPNPVDSDWFPGSLLVISFLLAVLKFQFEVPTANVFLFALSLDTVGKAGCGGMLSKSIELVGVVVSFRRPFFFKLPVILSAFDTDSTESGFCAHTSFLV